MTLRRDFRNRSASRYSSLDYEAAMDSILPWDQTATCSSLEVVAAVVVVQQIVDRDIHSVAVDVAVAASCVVAYLAASIPLQLELDILVEAFQVEAVVASYQETAVAAVEACSELVLQKDLLDFAVVVAAEEVVDQDLAAAADDEAAVEQSLAAVEVQEQTGPLHAFESVAVQSAE